MKIVSRQPAQGETYPPGTERIEFTSAYDGATDWFYYTPGDSSRRTVVFLHGAFSDGTQIYTREDVRRFWLTRVQDGKHPLLALNLRGTTYMNPATTADTVELLTWARRELGCREITFLGGSGGAFSALIYGMLHPQDLQGLIALGACDIVGWYEYAAQSLEPLLQRLAESLRTAYGGTPAQQQQVYQERSIIAHPERLTMPVVLTIGECDALIPVAETRKVAQTLRGHSLFTYVEVPGGDHDSAVWVDIDLKTCRIRGQ
ncbi:MAG: alpha/beta fold hydrolase [Anaerolineae bacterium]